MTNSVREKVKDIIQKYIIDTQFWVSLMISSLCLFFGLLHQHIDYSRICIVFFSTIASYNFIYFHSRWLKNKFQELSFYIFFIAISGILFLLFKENNLELSLNVLFIGVFVLMYNPNFINIQFRNISLLKIFVISFVWSYSVLSIGNTIFISVFEFFSVFLFIIGITIPFDICDVNKDSIITIPKLLGVKKSKFLSCVCLLTSTILFFFIFHKSTDISYMVSWGTSGLIAGFMVLFMRGRNLFFLTRFWMEACSALPLLLVILQKIRVVF